MKRKIATTVLITALVAAALVGVAGTATAHPYKTKACSACHGSSSAPVITITRASSTATTVTYNLKITGGKGSTGWAAFLGASTNLAHKSATTGRFTLKKGKTYKIWTVKTGSGAKYKSLIVK